MTAPKQPPVWGEKPEQHFCAAMNQPEDYNGEPLPGVDELQELFVPDYTIISFLGKGGNGAVYLAQHNGLERKTALKLVPDTPAVHPEIKERFRKEAVLLSSINHPAVVKVFDSGKRGKYLYYAMEYLPGGNLAERLQREPTHAVKMHWLKTIAEGLAYLHERGIIHRDVKPSNLIFNRENMPVLTDFGLAANPDSGDSNWRLSDDTGGAGSLQFTAPEQLQALGLSDCRSDIFSFGVLYFYVLSNGKLPADSGGRLPKESDIPFPGLAEKVYRAMTNPVVERRMQTMETVLRKLEWQLGDSSGSIISGKLCELFSPRQLPHTVWRILFFGGTFLIGRFCQLWYFYYVLCETSPYQTYSSYSFQFFSIQPYHLGAPALTSSLLFSYFWFLLVPLGCGGYIDLFYAGKKTPQGHIGIDMAFYCVYLAITLLMRDLIIFI